MRLIDADFAQKEICEACGGDLEHCLASKRGVCKSYNVISNAPTVFDIDKFLELIEADYEGLMKALEIAEATAAVKETLKAKLLENETVQVIIHQCRG